MRNGPYLEKEVLEFYGKLVEEISEKRDEASAKIQSLMEEDRYRFDFVYRTVVDTVSVADYYIGSRHQEIIPKAAVLIEKSMNLGLWEFATRNLNMLGASYQILDMLEKALECYNEIIRIEMEQEYIDISPLAYNNIGLMYLNLRAYKRAASYLKKAVELEERVEIPIRMHGLKLAVFKSHQVIVLSRTGYLDEAEALLNEIKEIEYKDFGNEANYHRKISELNYLFYTGKFEEARSLYKEGLETLGKKRRAWKRVFLSEFIELSMVMKKNYAFYMDALLLLVDMYEEDGRQITPRVFDSLRKYYRQIGDTKLYEEYTERYLKELEKKDDNETKAKIDSIELVENLIEESKTISKMKTLNHELKLVADEALRHKRELQHLNKTLRLINDIGKNMTSSLELSKVIDMIYAYILENVPMSSFVIALGEPEKNQLRTLAYYDGNDFQTEFSVSLDNPDSIFVSCYKTEELIISDDVQNDEKFSKHKPIFIGVNDIRSVIYMPLKVGKEIVGVCSVQSEKIGVYKKEYVDFLQLFSPYLSIAINNAVYSEKLEGAIRIQKKAQEELEKANKRLEHLSSLDGLTKINNRRDFEKKILRLISLAVTAETTVAVVMADIDNFKVYNDTYGHLEGDEALKKVAKVIRTVLDKAGGISARFGGEEFVGAGEGFSREDILEIGWKICNGVRELEIENERTIEGRLTVSIGIAFMKATKGVVKSKLMKEADDALYQAKKTGKNRVVLTEI